MALLDRKGRVMTRLSWWVSGVLRDIARWVCVHVHGLALIEPVRDVCDATYPSLALGLCALRSVLSKPMLA
ncbi:MAG: hypothetical protein ACRBN8_32390 [Nannocystales bacterium]